MKKILSIFVLALFFGCTPILKPIDLQIENKENHCMERKKVNKDV